MARIGGVFGMQIGADARTRWSGTSVGGALFFLMLFAACSSSQSGQAQPLPPAEAVERTWIDFITAAAGQVDLPEPSALATDNAWDAAATAFTEPRLPQTFLPQISIDDTGTVADIEDCSLFSFPLVDSPYIRLSGRASAVETNPNGGVNADSPANGNNGWLITELDVRPAEHCIPGDVAAEILTAYEQFWDRELIFSDPPDPRHPLIEQTLTGRRLQRKRAVLEWQVENNASYRGRPTTSPGISEIQPGIAIVIDCQTPDPSTGFYDRVTDQRRPELPPPTPGQTDLVQTWLELDDGRWKVEFSGVEADSGCDPAIPPNGTMEIVGSANP